MSIIEERVVNDSLRWLSNLEISSDSIEKHLQRCLGCWAAEVLLGVPQGQPGDRPLHQVLDVRAFGVSDYTGSPILALTIQAGLHVRNLKHESLTNLTEAYAEIINSADLKETESTFLVKALLSKAGFDVLVPLHELAMHSDWRIHSIEDRDELLRICNTVATSSVWGSREVDVGHLAEILPRLAVSYAMEWDLEAVSEILRACAYLGLSQQASVNWAQEWLIEQHSDGRFGLILPECQLLGRKPEDDSLFFLPTVRALWALGEIKHTGFLLCPTDNFSSMENKMRQVEIRNEPTHPHTSMESNGIYAEGSEKRRSKYTSRKLGECRSVRDGIEPGTLAPAFCLPSFLGHDEISLSDYQGIYILLVFVDPHCKPCDEVISHLVDFDKKCQRDGFQIILISRGDPEANRLKMAPYNVHFPVVLQRRWTISRLYGVFNFPAAFLINGEGVIAREVVRGPDIVGILNSFSQGLGVEQ